MTVPPVFVRAACGQNVRAFGSNYTNFPTRAGSTQYARAM
jgi:hypothetical protein